MRYQNLGGTSSREFQVGPDKSNPLGVLGLYEYDQYTVQGSTVATTSPGTIYRSYTTTNTLDVGLYRVSALLFWGHANANRDGFFLLRAGGTLQQTARDRNSVTGAAYKFPVNLIALVPVATPGNTLTVEILYYTSAGTIYINESLIEVERKR